MMPGIPKGDGWQVLYAVSSISYEDCKTANLPNRSL